MPVHKGIMLESLDKVCVTLRRLQLDADQNLKCNCKWKKQTRSLCGNLKWKIMMLSLQLNTKSIAQDIELMLCTLLQGIMHLSIIPVMTLLHTSGLDINQLLHFTQLKVWVMSKRAHNIHKWFANILGFRDVWVPMSWYSNAALG